MKIANFISKTQKSVYQFCDIKKKFASIIFTNVAIDNFDTKFPGASQIFYFNEQQKEALVKTTENKKEIIQFNDSNYLGQYVNKVFNNLKSKATRFDYAHVEFSNKDYWQHMYEIVGTMDGESSTLVIRIKENVLKECLECKLDNLEQYKSLFIQRILNIGMISVYQLSLISQKTLKGGISEFEIRCLNTKEDFFASHQRKLLYKSGGRIYYQMGLRSMGHKPDAVVGEVYPQLE